MSVAANRYARALIDVLPPAKAEEGYEQLVSLNGLLDKEVEARKLFENPTVPVERRKLLLKKIAAELGFSAHVRNFIDLLIDRNRLPLLQEIIRAYQKFLDERLGIVRAAVTAAQPLDDGQRRELTAKLEKATGKRVRMDIAIDRSLLGGVVARVGSTIYDGTLLQQLKSVRERLVEE
jgi:F-type H+-transporting ATPase subunit delta